MIVAVAARNLDDVALRAVLTGEGGTRGLGEVMARLLEAVTQRHEDRQLAAMALMVWSEALRNPELAERLLAAIAMMTDELAELIRARQRADELTGTPAEALAQAVLSLLPGFLFQTTLLGTEAIAGIPDAVRALWPN